MDDSEDEDLPSFGSIASLSIDEGEVYRVLKVFPNQGLSREEVRQDLRRSGSAEATINRILDNQVSWEEARNSVGQHSKPEAIQTTYGNVEVLGLNGNKSSYLQPRKTLGERPSETLKSPENCLPAGSVSTGWPYETLSAGNGLSATLVSCENQECDSDISICIVEEIPLAERLKGCAKSHSGYSSETVSRFNHGSQVTDSCSFNSNIGGSSGNGVVQAHGDDSDSNDLWMVDKSSQESSGCLLQATTSSGWSQIVDSQESEGSGKGKRPRQKLTEEERERRTQERLAKKAAKEQEKLEKRRAREDLMREKKLAKEKEKAEKQAKKKAQKATSRDECVKLVKAVIDELIAKEAPVGLQMMATLEQLGINVEVRPLQIPRSIIWEKKIFQENVTNVSKDLLSSHIVEDNEVVVLWPAEEFVGMVEAYCNQRTGRPVNGQLPVEDCVKELLGSVAPKRCSLVVYGLEKHYKSIKTKTNRKYRSAVLTSTDDTASSSQSKRKKNDEPVLLVTHVDVEEALASLSIHVPCQVHTYESGPDIGNYLARMTKAIAKAQYIQQNDETALSALFQEACRGHAKTSKNGLDMSTLWKRQLMQFPNVSSDVANSIACQYPSVRSLREAYKRCTSEGEADALLEDLMVQRGVGILSTSRRVGSVLSKRIHIVFTSQNPEDKLSK